jgi:hypothetical protein
MFIPLISTTPAVMNIASSGLHFSGSSHPTSDDVVAHTSPSDAIDPQSNYMDPQPQYGAVQ